MFLINTQSKDSIYLQIKTQILRFVQMGVLKENDKLPSVRELAKELGINPNTVMKAYSELEEEGIIYTLTKKGAFISSKTANTDNNELLMIIQTLKKEKKVTKQQWLNAVEKIYWEDELC